MNVKAKEAIVLYKYFLILLLELRLSEPQNEVADEWNNKQLQLVTKKCKALLLELRLSEPQNEVAAQWNNYNYYVKKVQRTNFMPTVFFTEILFESHATPSASTNAAKAFHKLDHI